MIPDPRPLDPRFTPTRRFTVTNTNFPAITQQRPPIVLSAQDYARLSVLAYAAMNSMPSLAEALTEELERARVLAKGRQPEHIVCMDSEVEFRNETSGKIQKVTLVYPEDADISEGKISVLTPVGTALIGLRTGQSITWETPGGDVRQLTVLEVRDATSARG
jgi:regulator of nucleoside diphosphate kinase